MKTRKKKTARQKKIKYLDSLWGKIIHGKYKACCWCGKPVGNGKFDAHHIFGRGLSVKWDTRTGRLLCFYCHHYRLRKDSEGFRQLIIDEIGEKEYTKLYMRSKTSLHNADLKAIELLLLSEIRGNSL